SLRGAVDDAVSDTKAWSNRARDISLILDSLPEIERRAPALQGKMDRSRIGVGGHSFGAYTAQLIGGATIDLPGGASHQSFADPRARAILLLSPQGAGQMGLTEHSWDRWKLPMMTMTGSLDRGAQGQSPDWRMQPFQHAPSGDRYALFIEGAAHLS